jgi:hypothetical protein
MHGINKAIQICSGCYKKAVYQVGGESKRRVVIPEGHDLTKFRDDREPWWLGEKLRVSKKGKEYLHGCLACKKPIKFFQKAK